MWHVDSRLIVLQQIFRFFEIFKNIGTFIIMFLRNTFYFWGSKFQKFKISRQQYYSPNNSTTFMSWMFFCTYLQSCRPDSSSRETFFLGRKRQNTTSLWRPLQPTYHSLSKNFWSQCVKLMLGRVLQVWWRLAQRFWRYIEKSGGGLKIAPPPPGRGLKVRQMLRTKQYMHRYKD